MRLRATRQGDTLPLVLSLYLVASMLPGLFGILPATTTFIVYQIVCFGVIFLYALYHHIKRGSQSTLFTPGARFAFSYAGILAISAIYATLVAISHKGSLTDISQFILPPLLAIILMVGFGDVSISKQGLKNFLKIVVYSLTISSLYNIVTNFNDIINITTITSSYETDLKGFFFNRNVFGFMMALGVACALYLRSSSSKKSSYIIPIVILSISLFATMSRGAIIFLAIFALIFFIGKAKSKLRTGLKTGLILVPLALIITGQPFIQDNFIRAENGDTGRSELREFGLHHYQEGSLLFGDGASGIKVIEKEFNHSSYHNLYLETLVTQGVAGIFALATLLFFSWNNIRKLKSFDKTLSLFFTATFIAFLTYSLIEAPPLFYATPNSLTVTYLLILLPILVLNNTQKENER